MSLRWMSAVFAAPEPQGTDRLMLLALADNANDEGVCWPGVETLQRKCGLGTRRAAEKALRRVEEWSNRIANDPNAPRRGASGCASRSGQGGRASTTWSCRMTLLRPCPPPNRGTDPNRRTGVNGRTGVPPNARTDPPSNAGTGEVRTPGRGNHQRTLI